MLDFTGGTEPCINSSNGENSGTPLFDRVFGRKFTSAGGGQAKQMNLQANNSSISNMRSANSAGSNGPARSAGNTKVYRGQGRGGGANV